MVDKKYCHGGMAGWLKSVILNKAFPPGNEGLHSSSLPTQPSAWYRSGGLQRTNHDA